MKTHRKYLKKQLADETLAREFECEKKRLRIAYDIHSARERLGLTQQALAQKAGVTQQMVSRIENASAASMAHGSVCKIAATLGMEVGLVPKGSLIERPKARARD
jgi:transcriptional regulator with XRE-family HTH domain